MSTLTEGNNIEALIAQVVIIKMDLSLASKKHFKGKMEMKKGVNIEKSLQYLDKAVELTENEMDESALVARSR